MNDGTFVNESAQGMATEPGRTYGGTVEQTEGTVRRVWYAGLGAAASAYDAATDSFDRFVDRGQRAQDDLQQRIDEVRTRRDIRRGRAGDSFRSAMNFFLDSLNVPNKADVDTINAKLNIVTRKLDDLQYEQVRATTPPPPPTAPAVAPDEPVPPDEAEGMIGI